MTNLDTTSKEKLRQLVEGIERLLEEKKEISEHVNERYAEAKSLGFDVKALKQVIRLRAQDRQEREELEQILDVYLLSLEEI